jgi:hypothetical protein
MIKKVIIFIAIFLQADILPTFFSKCISIKSTNFEIPMIKDNFIEIKKYSCNIKSNKIIFIGVTKTLPGVLKIRNNINNKDFLLKHVWIKRHFSALYIDKYSKTGSFTIQITKTNAIKFIFHTTNYKEIFHLSRKLNFKKIKEAILNKEIENTL